jgi:hypothetical protein
MIGFRPEKVVLKTDKDDSLYCRKVEVLTREMLGSETHYKVRLLNPDNKGDSVTVMVKTQDLSFAPDQIAYICVGQSDLYYFGEDGQRIRDVDLLKGMYQLTTEGGSAQ